MFSLRSLRTKTILSALVPLLLVLMVSAALGPYAHERIARDVVLQRDAELARISAARLSTVLNPFSRGLQAMAARAELRSSDPIPLRKTLENGVKQLPIFDAGLAVYSEDGLALQSSLGPPQSQATFPVPSLFSTVRETLRPAFSDVFATGEAGDEVILIGGPGLHTVTRLIKNHSDVTHQEPAGFAHDGFSKPGRILSGKAVTLFDQLGKEVNTPCGFPGRHRGNLTGRVTRETIRLGSPTVPLPDVCYHTFDQRVFILPLPRTYLLAEPLKPVKHARIDLAARLIDRKHENRRED